MFRVWYLVLFGDYRISIFFCSFIEKFLGKGIYIEIKISIFYNFIVRVKYYCIWFSVVVWDFFFAFVSGFSFLLLGVLGRVFLGVGRFFFVWFCFRDGVLLFFWELLEWICLFRLLDGKIEVWSEKNYESSFFWWVWKWEGL